MTEQRLGAFDAARMFIAARFPGSRAAFLAGSVVRGDATPTSDLDIVVITDDIAGAYRESMREYGWPIEAFVHTRTSYRDYFASDASRYRPSLARMIAEGIVLCDEAGLADSVKAEARTLLERGPEPLSPARRDAMRYHVTDLLDDFTGSDRRVESMFVGIELAEATVELLLVNNGHWAGSGKWVPRALAEYDQALASELESAVASLAAEGDKEPLACFCDRALAAAGGRLFEGYSSGKQ